MREKSQDTFQLTMVLLLCGVGVVIISPFAVVRLARGELVIAALDAGLVVGMALIAAWAWYVQSARHAAVVLAVFYTAGYIAVIESIGATGLYWVYPITLSNYFLLSLRMATLISAVVGVLLLIGGFFPTLTSIEHGSMLMALFMVNLCAFIFSHRTATQRNELDKLATRDPLTLAGNRRLLDSELGLAIARWNRHRVPTSVILLDLDHFKDVNDTFGHETGDQLLIQLVELARGRIRQADQLFRYGGEEFVIVMPDCGLEDAAQLAQSLRALVAERLTSPTKITASFGCAELRDGETGESCLSRADRALYRAKHGGRNRVEVEARMELVNEG